MCGIAGIVASDRLHADERDAAPADARRHHASRAGRCGDVLDDQAALGHRRLSIVDLAAGHQPLSNEDETVWIVFNGEIYNHADVRPELEAAGHRYRTRSDTETIVHAYEQWGDACVERLRGMFAFAIWDAPRRRLLLARDRLGVKPLYWAMAGGRLLFGSEIKSILESGLIRAAANEARASGAAEHALSLRRRNPLQGHPSAAARAHAGVRGRRDHDARSTGTSRSARVRRSSPALRPDVVVQFPRAARGSGPDPADGRRAARHVPVRAASTAAPSRR